LLSVQGNGLCLQEQYREAEAAYRAGLLAQPTHAQLLQRLRELQESGQICRAASDVSDVSATRGTVRYGAVGCRLSSRLLVDCFPDRCAGCGGLLC
jgi:hypothetical protein